MRKLKNFILMTVVLAVGNVTTDAVAQARKSEQRTSTAAKPETSTQDSQSEEEATEQDAKAKPATKAKSAAKAKPAANPKQDRTNAPKPNATPNRGSQNPVNEEATTGSSNTNQRSGASAKQKPKPNATPNQGTQNPVSEETTTGSSNTNQRSGASAKQKPKPNANPNRGTQNPVNEEATTGSSNTNQRSGASAKQKPKPNAPNQGTQNPVNEEATTGSSNTNQRSGATAKQKPKPNTTSNRGTQNPVSEETANQGNGGRQTGGASSKPGAKLGRGVTQNPETRTIEQQSVLGQVINITNVMVPGLPSESERQQYREQRRAQPSSSLGAPSSGTAPAPGATTGGRGIRSIFSDYLNGFLGGGGTFGDLLPGLDGFLPEPDTEEEWYDFANTVAPYDVSNSGQVRISEWVQMGGDFYDDVLSYSVSSGTFTNRGGQNHSLHNLNGQYTILTGYIGRVDGEPEVNGVFRFFGDGRPLQSFEVSGNALPRFISVNVEDVKQLRIEFSAGRNTRYAFCGAIQ